MNNTCTPISVVTNMGKHKAAIVGDYNTSLRIFDHIMNRYNPGIRSSDIYGQPVDIVAYIPVAKMLDGQTISCKLLDTWPNVAAAYQNRFFDFLIVAMSKNIDREGLLDVLLKYSIDAPVFWVDEVYSLCEDINSKEASEMFLPTYGCEGTKSIARMLMIGTDDICCKAVEKIYTVYNEYIEKWNIDTPLISVTYYSELGLDCRKHSHIYGVPTIPLYEIGERYKRGEFNIIVAPAGIYTYALALIRRDGVPENCMYVVDEDVLTSIDDYIIPVSVLKPFKEERYVHRKLIPNRSTDSIFSQKQRVCKCKICFAEERCAVYEVKDMRSEGKDLYEYFICPECDTLQLVGTDSNSISFADDIEESKNNEEKELYIDYRSIGCIDKLAEKQRKYDVIRLDDSFESFIEPMEILEKLKNLMAGNGIIEMSLIAFPSIAFEIFGPYWSEIDPSRHVVIYSKKSIEYIADKAGLFLYDYSWETNDLDLAMSYLYMNGYSYEESTELIRNGGKWRELEELEYLSGEAADHHFSGKIKLVFKEKCWK